MDQIACLWKLLTRLTRHLRLLIVAILVPKSKNHLARRRKKNKAVLQPLIRVSLSSEKFLENVLFPWRNVLKLSPPPPVSLSAKRVENFKRPYVPCSNIKGGKENLFKL